MKVYVLSVSYYDACIGYGSYQTAQLGIFSTPDKAKEKMLSVISKRKFTSDDDAEYEIAEVKVDGDIIKIHHYDAKGGTL